MEKPRGATLLASEKAKMETEEPVLIKDLQDVDIFAGLSDHELEPITKICSQRTYQADERCVVEGETIDELYIVNKGKVAIELRIQVAPYTQTLGLATLTRGKVFAWSALMEPQMPTASARCTEKTQVICIKASDLENVFEERPSLERVVMKNLATVINSKLRDSYSQLTSLATEMIKQGK